MSALRSLGYAISRTTALLVIALLILGVLVAGIYYYMRAPPAAPPTPLGLPVQKITIITTTEGEDPVRWAAVQAIAAEWRKLGFEVEVIGLEASMVDKKCYYEWDFDVCVFGWGARVDRLDPNLFLGLITTEEIGVKGEGANNPTGYSNPEYDRLYDLQRRTLDINERRRIVFEMQRIFHEEVPRYNIYHKHVIVAYRSDKWANPIIMPGAPLFNEWQPYFITPTAGGMQELIYGSNTEPDTLHPVKASLIFSWYVLKLVYDPLVRLTPEGKPVPWLAEEVKVIDPTTVEVRLRSNLRFHDGKPITADDVVFTYKYYIKHEFAYFRPYWRNIEDVIKVDDLTVRFKLKTPDATFMTNTLYMIPILPKHVWENVDPKAVTEEQLRELLKVGSGPFKNPVWVRKEYIAVEVAPEHFAYRGVRIGDFEVPPIKVSRIIIRIYGDLDSIVSALIRREIDATAVSILPGHVDVLARYDYIRVVKARNFALDADLMFNVRRSPFDIKEVRQALLYAIPYDHIINVILKGYGEKGYIIAPVNSFWHNPDVKAYEYNLEKARELLAKAGFKWDDKGRIYYPVGFTPRKQEDP